MSGFNIQFQIIALILILMVLTLFGARRKLRITRERVFLGMIIACLSSCILDVLSVVSVLEPYYISVDASRLIRRLYLISVSVVALLVLMYTLAEVYRMAIFETTLRKLYFIPVLLSIPAFMRLPLDGGFGGAGGFGPAVICLYGDCLFYMTVSLLYAIVKGDEIKNERKNVIFMAPMVLLFCGLFQYRYQDIRVLSLGISIVLTYMYMVLESPDVYVDKTFNTFNRDAFFMYLENRCREKKPVSVLYVSVNEFSNMNEIAGTVITSELMRSASEYLRSFESGRLFFLDAGNFVLTFERDAHFFEYAQEIRNRFSKVWVVDESFSKNMVEFEIRAGVVAYGAVRMPSGISAESIVSTILYFSRKMTVTGEDYINIDRRQIWEMESMEHVKKEIEGAVEEGRVDVFYQPVFSVYENKCSEVEALIRVRDRRNIYFENSLILPAAESTGEITALGYEVFRKICAFVRDNDLKKAGINKIAVNLSMVQCQQRLLSEKLIEIMAEYGVSASQFRFEISENTAEYMTQNLRRNMNRLIAQGSEFAIDDYGNRQIDPDKVTLISKEHIKLGESVIRKYFSGEKTKQSMRVLCRMLLQLKMIIAAVGVEDQKQYAELKNLGVTHMQGNAFFRPMPGEQLLPILENEKAIILGKEEQFERTL